MQQAFNMRSHASMFLLLLFLANYNNILLVVEGLWISFPSTETKCVMEEIKNNVVVLGDYYAIIIHENSTIASRVISAKVTSPNGDTLHHSEDVRHGQFAFTTSIAGEYTACFWVNKEHQQDNSVTIGLDWKTGIATKDWESVAKKEKLEGVELEVVKLKGLVEQIQEDLLHLMTREYGMRQVSEKTNARVVWFGSVSLGVCILTSISQLLYLKRFFRKKKLI